MNVLILHGPNLRLLDGEFAYDSLEAVISAKAKALGLEVRQVQANSEGALVDALQAQQKWLNAVIINPSSIAPTAYSLADALIILKKPCIEVQLFNEVANRGRSALKGIVGRQLHGKGVDGYILALTSLSTGNVAVKAKVAQTELKPRFDPTANPRVATNSQTPETRKKTIGRKEVSPVAAAGAPQKSIGPRAEKLTEQKTRINESQISRALIREKLTERLSGKLNPGDFAMWAREKWQSLQWGGNVELGQREKLEEMLMMLAASSKQTDAALLEYIARLDS